MSINFNKLPAWVPLLLGILSGVLEYLNVQTFAIQPVWHNLILYGTMLLGALGIRPVVGAMIGTDLRAIVHVPPVFYTILNACAFGASAIVVQSGASTEVKGIVLGVVSFLTWAGIAENPTAAVNPQVPASAQGEMK